MSVGQTQMKFSILYYCVLCFFIALSPSLAQAESYARVCATTVDAEANEAPLTEKSSPGVGGKLVVHLDANNACAALILPLVENRRILVNGWRPQMVELAQWDEKTLPDSRRVWNWNKGADPFELWIFFFKKDGASVGTLNKLVAAMEKPELSENTLAQQTQKLCEILGERMTGKQQIAQGPKASATLLGGSMRATDFPWRNYAQKVSLSDALEGTWVLRHGR